MKYLLTTCIVVLAVWLGLKEEEAAAGCCGVQPGFSMVWADELPVIQTNVLAANLKMGSVKGELSFEKRRPKQPVVVFLQRIDGELKYKIPEDENIKQKNARFEPSFLAVVMGQKIVFDNDENDDINHNVYFLGEENKDLGVFGNNKKRGHVFNKAGEVEVYCSIHSMMDAKVFVAPNPHFVILSKDEKSFELKNVPEGKYLLKTYQKAKRFKDASETITVTAGKQMIKKLLLKR